MTKPPCCWPLRSRQPLPHGREARPVHAGQPPRARVQGKPRRSTALASGALGDPARASGPSKEANVILTFLERSLDRRPMASRPRSRRTETSSSGFRPQSANQ